MIQSDYKDINYIFLFRLLQLLNDSTIAEIAEKMGYTSVYCNMVLIDNHNMSKKFKRALIVLTEELYGSGAAVTILENIESVLELHKGGAVSG